MRVSAEVPPAVWRSVGPAAKAAEAAGFDAPTTVEPGHDVLAPVRAMLTDIHRIPDTFRGLKAEG